MRCGGHTSRTGDIWLPGTTRTAEAGKAAQQGGRVQASQASVLIVIRELLPTGLAATPSLPRPLPAVNTPSTNNDTTRLIKRLWAWPWPTGSLVGLDTSEPPNKEKWHVTK